MKRQTLRLQGKKRVKMLLKEYDLTGNQLKRDLDSFDCNDTLHNKLCILRLDNKNLKTRRYNIKR